MWNEQPRLDCNRWNNKFFILCKLQFIGKRKVKAIRQITLIVILPPVRSALAILRFRIATYIQFHNISIYTTWWRDLAQPLVLVNIVQNAVTHFLYTKFFDRNGHTQPKENCQLTCIQWMREKVTFYFELVTAWSSCSRLRTTIKVVDLR